jgi:ComF family protein
MDKQDVMLKIGRQLLDLLAPCYCMVCGLPSRRSIALCQACEQELAGNSPACPRCAAPLANKEPLAIPAPLCGRCQVSPPAFQHTIAPHLYTGPLSTAIKAMKFKADLSVLAALAHLLAGDIARQLAHTAGPDYLVPMPLHWWRHWRRGFNQAELLAQELCRHPQLSSYNLQVAAHICRRTRATRPQAGLGALERAKNMQSSMYCPRSMNGLHLAIVDDVMTTGASANALASVLLAAGAARVDVWCCARTPGPLPDSAKRS